MIVLDTNVVSELMLSSPLARVVDWVSRQAVQDLYLSTIIWRMLDEDFAGRTLPFDRGATRAYAPIAAERRAAGHPISHADCQLEAVHRMLEVKAKAHTGSSVSELPMLVPEAHAYPGPSE